MTPSGPAATLSVCDLQFSSISLIAVVDLLVLDADVEHRVARLEEAAARQHLGHAQLGAAQRLDQLAGVLSVDDGDQELRHVRIIAPRATP